MVFSKDHRYCEAKIKKESCPSGPGFDITPVKCDLTIKMSSKKYIEGIDNLGLPDVRKKPTEKIRQLKAISTGSAHGAEKMPDRS